MQQYSMLDQEVFTTFVRNPGELIEVRLLGCSEKSYLWDGYAKGTVVGYYDEYDPFRKDLAKLIYHDQNYTPIKAYMSLQVIDPQLLSRSPNRLTALGQAIKKEDVLFYRWLPIDLDPVRTSGTSSSDEQLELARQLSEEIYTQLGAEGWPAPIRAMSGNGYHLLYPLNDLPAQDPEVQKGVKIALANLSKRFSNNHVNVDTALHDPPRIIKLYGTTAHKGYPVTEGPGTDARPHRKSYIYDIGE